MLSSGGNTSNLAGSFNTFAGSVTDTGGCEDQGGLRAFLDALVFQFTTFSTVGYGTHPVNFLTMTSQLCVVAYILIGVVIMGVMAGSIGVLALKKINRLTDKIADIIEAGTMEAVNLAKAPDPEEEKLKEVSASSIHSPFWQISGAFVGMIFVMGLGAVCFHYLEEDMPFHTALYFTTVTVTTVGFGDIAPESTKSKIFSLFFVPFGVVFFANAVGALSDLPLASRKAKLEA